MRAKNHNLPILSLPALLCMLVWLTPGCMLGVAAAGVGYAIYGSKKGDALVAAADARQQQAYNEYKLGMERINLDREKSQLFPRPILPMDEWLKWQAMPENERAEVIEKRPPKLEEYQEHLRR